MELLQASHQWMSRPADERFTSLHDMSEHFHTIRQQSRAFVSSTRRIEARPTDAQGMEIVTDKLEMPVAPTHHAFGQVATLAKAPDGYLRSLPAPIAADCLNYGLRFKRDIDARHNEAGARTGFFRSATGKIEARFIQGSSRGSHVGARPYLIFVAD